MKTTRGTTAIRWTADTQTASRTRLTLPKPYSLIGDMDDIMGDATDLEGALEKILFTPLPVKLVKNIYCQRCDAKKKVPADTVEVPCECGAVMR